MSSTEGHINDRKIISIPLLFNLHQMSKINMGPIVSINTANNIVIKAITGEVPILDAIQ